MTRKEALKRLRNAMERSEVSQADLARLLRRSPSNIARMMAGERAMKIAEVEPTAKALGMPIPEMLRVVVAIYNRR